MTLEDIASSQSCSVEELLDSIEGIVASGTKVALDYILDEYLDEDSVEELWECFMESEEGTVAEVMEEMEDCLLYTSPSPRDLSTSRMPSSA